jgi:hypothetical protein
MIVTRKFSGSAVRMPVSKSRPQYAAVGEEPAVEDLLADPVVRAMMVRDRVCEADLRNLIHETRTALSLRGG